MRGFVSGGCGAGAIKVALREHQERLAVGEVQSARLVHDQHEVDPPRRSRGNRAVDRRDLLGDGPHRDPDVPELGERAVPAREELQVGHGRGAELALRIHGRLDSEVVITELGASCHAGIDHLADDLSFAGEEPRR